jgi:hypothetical protein
MHLLFFIKNIYHRKVINKFLTKNNLKNKESFLIQFPVELRPSKGRPVFFSMYDAVPVPLNDPGKWPQILISLKNLREKLSSKVLCYPDMDPDWATMLDPDPDPYKVNPDPQT